MDVELRSRSGWLLSFSDLITLLITFFIMVIVTNKTDVTVFQKWSEQQLSAAFEIMQDEFKQKQLEDFELHLLPHGILIRLPADKGFGAKSLQINAQFEQGLERLAPVLMNSPLLNKVTDPKYQRVLNLAAEKGLDWVRVLNIEGHTDHEWINPLSELRNHWFVSAIRAQAVLAKLIELGLPAEQMIVSGYGAYQPIVDVRRPDAKVLNRRIDIVVTASFELRQE
jgi:chemotaxis protein MotB